MRCKDFQRSDLATRAMRAALAGFVVISSGAASAGSVQAHASPMPRRVVTPSEQVARDSERTEILRQELKRSEEELEGIERRRAERLGASDLEAANETRQQQARLRVDIAALKRELASAARHPGGTPAQPPASDRPVGSRLGATARIAAPAPRWWDVYGAPRLVERPAPLASTPANAIDVPVRGHLKEE